MHKEKILYIDMLKGLAMLLVVLGHTIYFCMYNEAKGIDDTVLSIVCTFHVQLFFFLSGIVVSGPPSGAKFLKKARRFLLPMLTVGLVNAIVISRVGDFFLSSGHNGYWYLLTLTVFYLLLMPFHITAGRRSLGSFVADVAIAIIVWTAMSFVMRIPYMHGDVLNISGAFAYWPFFICGYICHKYSIVSYVEGKPLLALICLFAYLFQLFVLFDDINDLSPILEYTLAFTAIAAVFVLFSCIPVAMLQPSSHSPFRFLLRQLLLIGQYTLYIYVYHYFFIRFIDLSPLIGTKCSIELLVTVSLTVVIAYGSIALGRAVRWTICNKNDFL